MNNQQLAFDKLSKLKVGALFMAMGTGKTKVALELMKSKKAKVDYMLWLCPYSTINEIESEKKKWNIDLEIDVVGIESISQSDRIFLNTYNKVLKYKTFIVVDESLKIKNRKAKRTKRIIKLGSLAKYKLVLNGTPVSKNVLDIYTQMNFLSYKILNMSYNQFKNNYCEYYVRGRLRGLVKKQYNIEHLISLIKPYIFDSELDLNLNKYYLSYNYELEDRETYENIKSNFLNFNNFDFMALSQSLQKQYCLSSGKQEIIDTIINNVDERIIVFVKFLSSIPDNSISINGSITNQERADIIQRFKNNEFKVLYITYGCGSFGLNLQFCKHIIFAEHTFDYSQREQAEARIFRIGQKDRVIYYDLDCNVGLERMIKASLNKKSNLLQEIKEEITKVGVENWVKNI